MGDRPSRRFLSIKWPKTFKDLHKANQKVPKKKPKHIEITENTRNSKKYEISRNHHPRRDVIRPYHLLLLDILLLQAFMSNRIVTIKMARFWCLYSRIVWIFKHVNANLRSILRGLGIRVEDWSNKQCKEQQEGSQGRQQSTVGHR